MVRAAGHVGLFAGIYVVGAVACVWQLAGFGGPDAAAPSWACLAGAGLIATGTYALDRVKLRDAWMDPADRDAQPERYAFLHAHSGTVRVLALVMLAAGAAVGSLVHVLAPMAAALAAIGVVAYAPSPRIGRRRLKDRFGWKNAYVAAGITGFAVLAAMADLVRSGRVSDFVSAIRWHLASLIAASGLVAMRALFDAAICDLDDEHADRRHGTATLPTKIGAEATWHVTGFARVLVPIATALCVWCPWRARVAWAIAGGLGVAALRARKPQTVRDIVDIRFAVEALAVSAALIAWPGGD